jgi:hypothetical protein
MHITLPPPERKTGLSRNNHVVHQQELSPNTHNNQKDRSNTRAKAHADRHDCGDRGIHWHWQRPGRQPPLYCFIVTQRRYCAALSTSSEGVTHPEDSSLEALPLLRWLLLRPSSCSAPPCLTSHPHTLLSRHSRSQPVQAGGQLRCTHIQVR